MTAARCLELLHQRHLLSVMRHYVRTVDCRDDTREAWALVSEAIADKVALLTAVLTLDADPALLVACEWHLAQEQQTTEKERCDAITPYPTTKKECCDAITTSPTTEKEMCNAIAHSPLSRPTIH